MIRAMFWSASLDMKTINVRGCSRCGADHDGLELRALTNPVAAGPGSGSKVLWSHWAECPTLHEPILVQTFIEKSEPESGTTRASLAALAARGKPVPKSVTDATKTG